MTADKREILKQCLASGMASLHPLTFPQRELWEASPVLPDDPANHICCLIDVQGTMTLPACEAALQSVVDRQEVLRLSFLPGRAHPVQMIRPEFKANLEFTDLGSSQCGDEAVDELATEVFRVPFDLLRGPLYRTALFRRGPRDNVIVFSIHHAIADGWSLGVFVQDLCLGYIQGLVGKREPLPPVAMTYSAWGAREREHWRLEELETRAEFWKNALRGAPRLWKNLEGAAAATGSHRRWITQLPSGTVDAAQALARTEGATLFSLLLTVFHLSISRWTGCDDFVFGSPLANRGIQAVRETMGYCASVVPLRIASDEKHSFVENLRAVHERVAEYFGNAMPFAELAAALGERGGDGRHPIYDVRFALQNHPVPDVSLHGLSARLKMRSTGTARFHIGCEVTLKAAGAEVVWLYRENSFSKVEIEDLARIFFEKIDIACRSDGICNTALF